MEFHQKLQELRKQRSMTQEELAEVLFVSRTAVSKWESGRGYPNLDSLQAIAAFFSVSVDQLLSCDEILTAAKEENQHEKNSLRVLIFGLLDVSIALFFFLPFFGQTVNGSVQNVSLGTLYAIHTPLKIIYITAVSACVLWGLDVHTAQDISEICKVDAELAKDRATRMKALYDRGKFLTNPLEKDVYDTFKPFIQSNTDNKKQ